MIGGFINNFYINRVSVDDMKFFIDLRDRMFSDILVWDFLGLSKEEYNLYTIDANVFEDYMKYKKGSHNV